MLAILGTIEPAAFGHAARVQMAYAMSAHYSFDEALVRYARGLRALARRAGQPGKFHMTITVALLSLIAGRRITAKAADWSAFIAANPDLLDRQGLDSWYDHGELAAALARETFVLPRVGRSAEGFG